MGVRACTHQPAFSFLSIALCAFASWREKIWRPVFRQLFAGDVVSCRAPWVQVFPSHIHMEWSAEREAGTSVFHRVA